MIYLTSGANGAGKTLLTLYDVRAQQLKENRPVYFNGFEAGQQLLDWGWQKFDPKEWQALPDGSICVMDEAQNEFPMRQAGSAVPDYVNAIAQFRRKRGFDFWMVTPHPRLLDVFIRRLIESPSWHRHLKRNFGADVVSELKFNFVNVDCDKPGSGDKGTVTTRLYPKEVYNWYRSASLHTGKKKLPRQFWILCAVAVAIPVFGWFAWQRVGKTKLTEKAEAQPIATAAPAGRQGPMSADEYAQSFKPRVPGLPHTAPRYDGVTAPQQAPMPVACVQTVARCQCYSQQATLMAVPRELCAQIVAGGFFRDDIPASHSLESGLRQGGPAKPGDGTSTGYGVQPHAELSYRPPAAQSLAAYVAPVRETQAGGAAATGARSAP
ncbi:MAG: hypothetical protein J0H69_19730 [Burkholderiales bacterium]|nr:hypothetical protein [Burkholderiales bacterium]